MRWQRRSKLPWIAVLLGFTCNGANYHAQINELPFDAMPKHEACNSENQRRSTASRRAGVVRRFPRRLCLLCS